MARYTRLLPVAAVFSALVAIPGSAALRGQGSAARLETAVDKIFDRWTAQTPGCAVGVASGGRSVLEKAYGMSDLERDVPNTPDTIFEAGSVSKQFTAAAVLLLAHDGKLSLDDPARKYLPELPDYGVPLTIRHMLQHTSGLRDWGSVANIAGWPRTSRVHTHAHVLDIVSRQRALNFPPGSHWSYSNTGYNLAVVIVSRVSGQSFAEFCRARIFEPLGMTRTSWRDDHTRIVKGRAMAYSEEEGGLRINMPFEDVHGNGGLLTTVGDLLRWNENFAEPKVGDADFLRQQQEVGRYSDGRAHDYALGLWVKTYKSVPEVGHAGTTAGYDAYLARYPGQHLSVAVLCNVSSAAAERLAHGVADLYLGNAAKPEQAERPFPLASDFLPSRAGLYVKDATGEPLLLVYEDGALRPGSGSAPPLVPLSITRFSAGGGLTIEFQAEGRAVVTLANGAKETYTRMREAKPRPEELAEYAGTYTNDEAEVVLRVIVHEGQLAMLRRPNQGLLLRPLYADGFGSPIGTVRFRRTDGRVTAMSLGMDRVWDMRFRKVE